MPRNSRVDFPGAWHHVSNRGIAKRTVFETREDMRYFLSLVARAVREGLIEVHAFCLLPNHFHLMVRSLTGDLARAMFLIENRYVRWFNRRRRRDGPLLRGRYSDALLGSRAHWEAVVWYIDDNPVQARLSECSATYPWSSTRLLLDARCPRWLHQGPVAQLIRSRATHRGPRWSPGAVADLVERRLSGRDRGPMPLDDLVRASPRAVRDWMVRKAALADGTPAGVRIAHPETVFRLIQHHRASATEISIEELRRCRDPWAVVEAGLLNEISGLSAAEAAPRLNITGSTFYGRVQLHRRALHRDAGYAARVARIAHEAIVADFGDLGCGDEIPDPRRRPELP
jgi:REP element-mobilizing transposase RayT